ncbi:MAG: hypothetical protein Q8L00_11020 [Deltaproteobacteria bacterium]|nr:hypothetical protein [Deltaproteobacteria bacterium]
MSKVFSFFLRLFLCFVAARFLLQAIGVEGRDYLVGLTLLFLVNVYWFSYLVFRDRKAHKVEAQPDPTGSPAAAAPEAEEPPVTPAPPGA